MARFLYLAAILALAANSLCAPTSDAAGPNIVALHPISMNGAMTSIHGPDGLYTAYNSTHMTYYGADSAISDDISLEPRALLETRQGCFTNCNGEFTNGADISGAQAGLRAHFVSYPAWKNNIVYVLVLP